MEGRYPSLIKGTVRSHAPVARSRAMSASLLPTTKRKSRLTPVQTSAAAME